MRTEIPYDFMPPEQHFNNPEALLRAIEHFQEARVLVDGDERFNPPPDKFEKLLKEDGGFVLMPTARDYAFLFRGQGGFYNQCLPTHPESGQALFALLSGAASLRAASRRSTSHQHKEGLVPATAAPCAAVTSTLSPSVPQGRVNARVPFSFWESP